MDYFWVIVIGVTSGLLAGHFMAGRGYGVTGDLIVGVAGALVGCALFERSGMFDGSGLLGSLAVATSGAMISLYGLRLTKKA
jgi:uncharacterized membrane protein YeaQ/YmgE (transglycosylase-associated protein family)